MHNNSTRGGVEQYLVASGFQQHLVASGSIRGGVKQHPLALGRVKRCWKWMDFVGWQLCKKFQISIWTDFFRAKGPKKMAFWLNLLSKLLCFERRYSQILKENLKYYEFFGLKSAKWLWKSPNSEKTACHRAFGPWKMDSSLNFTWKSLCFGGKYFSKDLLNINISRKKSLFDIFMKSPNSERTDFCRAMRPKEMDSSLNLRPKSLCFG